MTSENGVAKKVADTTTKDSKAID
jgi:hypothetical protein